MAFKKIIDSFTGPHAFLSNFYPCDGLEYHGIPCPTVEHAYQAHKAAFVTDGIDVATARTPALAKQLGRKVPAREDWERIKLTIMWGLVSQKFMDPTLADLLVGTGRAILIEGNTWGDTYWGVDKRQGINHGKGFNHLGQLLTVTRQLHIDVTEI